MNKLLSAALAGVALTMSVAMATPAHAYPGTTLCNNEPGDEWIPLNSHDGVGWDIDQTEYFFCVRTGLTGDPYQLVVIRPYGGQQTVCLIYSNDANAGNDICVFV